jgi:hypothetical protein
MISVSHALKLLAWVLPAKLHEVILVVTGYRVVQFRQPKTHYEWYSSADWFNRHRLFREHTS